MPRPLAMPPAPPQRFVPDLDPGFMRGAFARDVLAGLSARQKTISPKYLYDRAGSELFERICRLREYYPTRTELRIMQRFAGEMATRIGPARLLLELGSGSSLKTRLLLSALPDLVAYLPLDISHSALINAVRELHVEFPHLPIYPLTGDFQQPVEVPEHLCSLSEGTVVYFPGSTIGNLSPDAARQLLERLHGVCRGGGLLLGVDLQKEPLLLELAYNDREGVTAAFNINLLHHLNRELGANFDAGSFKHRALYQTRFHRIEMHLVSTRDQIVEVAGTAFHFRHGESICTEHSYKFTIPELRELAAASDFELKQTWTDDRHWFAVCYLTPR